jgi:prepilin signal peptidase PulO-like enzyme (type II secretory pathway)
MVLIYIIIFIFGTIIGSFLNVVIDRFNTGRGLGGRSKCDSTGRTLAWYELIPIFSYIFQGGKSLHSKTKLSLQYPLVEAGTGILFVLILHKFIPFLFVMPLSFLVAFLYSIYIFSTLVIIFVYDLKHKIIPNFFVFQFIILALVNSVILFLESGLVIFLLSGPLVALPLFLLWVFSKGKWIGFGDVKFALGMGWLLGISSGFSALLISFWIGAVFGLFILLIKKSKNHEIPFAPFLVLATVLCFLYNINMNSIARVFTSFI